MSGPLRQFVFFCDREGTVNLGGVPTSELLVLLGQVLDEAEGRGIPLEAMVVAQGGELMPLSEFVAGGLPGDDRGSVG